MGKVSRNCTEYGWSEPFPHYAEVCFFYDNTTKLVRLCGSFYSIWHVYQVHRLILCLSPLGSILRISQSPLHSRLQHVACVSDYSHGYSLQVQVSFLSIHPSIHPFLIHLQTSFTPATLSSRLACPENLQRKVSNMDPDAPTA